KPPALIWQFTSPDPPLTLSTLTLPVITYEPAGNAGIFVISVGTFVTSTVVANRYASKASDGPCGPVAPGAPWGPVAPGAPWGPVAPGAPWGPVAPAGPAGPAGP